MATSAALGSKGCTWASPCTKAALATPASAARCTALASICEERSTPSADPSDASCAASIVDRPEPHPMSMTWSVGPMLDACSKRAR